MQIINDWHSSSALFILIIISFHLQSHIILADEYIYLAMRAMKQNSFK